MMIISAITLVFGMWGLFYSMYLHSTNKWGSKFDSEGNETFTYYPHLRKRYNNLAKASWISLLIGLITLVLTYI